MTVCLLLHWTERSPTLSTARTIGKAKEHLENSAEELTNKLKAINGQAYVSVNKALVTRASAIIPVVPLYMALLYQVMKEKGLHEHCTQQIYRLFTTMLFSATQYPPTTTVGKG